MSAIVFNTNTLNRTTARSLNKTSENLANHTRKLSSGSRINKVGDDVASMTIATKTDTQLRGISKAKQNILDGVGHMETAYGASVQTLDNLQRIRELFVQGINGTNSVDEKDALQREINGLVRSQFAIADQTKVIVADNEFTGTSMERIVANDGFRDWFYARYQVGTNDGDTRIPGGVLGFVDSVANSISLSPGAGNVFGAGADGINLGLALENTLIALKIPGANVEPDVNILNRSPSTVPGDDFLGTGNPNTDTLDHIDTMISNVTRISSQLDSEIVALQERFNFLEAKEISLNESQSHFSDTDFAEESTAFTREQLRRQTAGAMFSQANAQAQFALSLLP
ncbi:MAG: flagellin [Candidatus Caenarcaniphilales bacterium]|nr:flagellin [Candidatus Caenarcaniphilales bacterium]